MKETETEKEGLGLLKPPTAPAHVLQILKKEPPGFSNDENFPSLAPTHPPSRSSNSSSNNTDYSKIKLTTEPNELNPTPTLQHNINNTNPVERLLTHKSVVFACSNKTEKECLLKKIFGDVREQKVSKRRRPLCVGSCCRFSDSPFFAFFEIFPELHPRTKICFWSN